MMGRVAAIDVDVGGFADYRAMEQWAGTGASNEFSGSINFFRIHCKRLASMTWSLRRWAGGKLTLLVVTSAFDTAIQISASVPGRCVSVAILPPRTSWPMTSSAHINHPINLQILSPTCRSYGADCAVITAMFSREKAFPRYPKDTAVRNATP